MEAGRRVAFATLGCKVNQYDTAAMEAQFRRAGYELVDFAAEADIYIINTCTVTGRAAAKSRQMIRGAIRRAPLAVIAVTGCYSQTDPDAVSAIPGVDLVVGTHDHGRIVELCAAAMAAERPVRAVNDIFRAAREFEETPVDLFDGKTRAVVKIQEGCNIFCTYCIIPYARGKPRSRRPADVYAEVARLAADGFREVVLTGIHLGSYGVDAGGRFTLGEVVARVADTDGIDRVRLSSLEPGHITAELIDLVANHPRVCPHLHLSLQSGSQGVLERMKRAYTAGAYRRTVQLLRERIPDLGLTTDVIVGFPGETEQEHRESMAFVNEMGFSRIHVFPYSPRQGTRAAGMPGQVPRAVKERRAREMIALGDELALAFHRRHLGRVVTVLAEGEAEAGAGWLEGYTPNYVRVQVPGGEELHNTLVPTRITAAHAEGCTGEVERVPAVLRRREST